MIISTWNIRGFTPANKKPIVGLLRTSDILCLTETWSQLEETAHWYACSSIAPQVNERNRKGGVVSILYKRREAFKPIATYSDPLFQLVHGIQEGIPILGAYLAPHIPKADMHRVLELASRFLQGPGVLVGDLNSRHNLWDDSYNYQGILLQAWARRHSFRTTRPLGPIFVSHSGGSRVDLILHRSSVPPSLKVLPKTAHSAHRPVRSELAHVSVAAMCQIRLSLIQNKECKRRVKEKYESMLPEITSSLNKVSTAESLENNCRLMGETILKPWTHLCKPRPDRFRPEWTQRLDRKAKLGTRLLRSSDPNDRTRARTLDREIKREFRTNLRRLKDDLGDLVAEGNPGTDTNLLKRALKLDQTSEVVPTAIDPDTYTEFMNSLQPNVTTTPKVQIKHFTVPDSFRAALLQAIRARLKQMKAPGPEKIRTDIFRISPELFADVALEVWPAIGRTAHVPSMFRIGLLVPIYKQNGNHSIPTNYRPVCLTTALRRLIGTALTHQLARKYASLPLQWVFQSGTNTECAVCLASNRIRRELPMTVILDLNKAYDTVPRHILQKMLDERLPHDLSVCFRPFLSPMLLQTKQQRSTTCVKTLVGMPQGDAPSPLLFNLFMDDYLRTINVKISRRLATLFVDNVLLLARPLLDMQRMLTSSKKWADKVGMESATHKSCGLQLPGVLLLGGKGPPG